MRIDEIINKEPIKWLKPDPDRLWTTLQKSHMALMAFPDFETFRARFGRGTRQAIDKIKLDNLEEVTPNTAAFVSGQVEMPIVLRLAGRYILLEGSDRVLGGRELGITVLGWIIDLTKPRVR